MERRRCRGLANGIYDVKATATDNAGNSGSDATTNELTVNTTPSTTGHNYLLHRRRRDDVGQSIATDASGNVYVTGSFHGTVDFDPGSGRLQSDQRRRQRRFVAKYTPSGRSLGPRHGRLRRRRRHRHRLGPNGAVYVAGSFSGTASFRRRQRPQSHLGRRQGRLCRQARFLGNLISGSRHGRHQQQRRQRHRGRGRRRRLYHGYFQGTADFDPGSSVYNSRPSARRTSLSPSSMPTATSSGPAAWAGPAGAKGRASAWASPWPPTAPSTPRQLPGHADFGLGTGGGVLVCAGDTDVFVSKLDSAGNFVWARDMGGPNADYGSGIAVAADGSVYTTGGFMGTADFGTYTLDRAGYHRIFVSKLDSAGNFVWARGVGEPVRTLPPASPSAPTAASTLPAVSGARPTSIPAREPTPYQRRPKGRLCPQARLQRQFPRRPKRRQRHGRRLRQRRRRDPKRRRLLHRLLPGHGQLRPQRGSRQSHQRRRGGLLPLQVHGVRCCQLSPSPAPRREPTPSGRASRLRGRPPTSRPAARSASATTPTPPSTATNTGLRSTACRPPTTAARTPGIPRGWRRAPITSPDTCTTAASTFTFSHLTQAITIQRAAAQPQAVRGYGPDFRHVSGGPTVNIPWTAANVRPTARSASATTPTPPSTATNTGLKSTACRPPTAAARTPGTPPGWRRAPITSPATCMAAARSPSRT